MVDDVLVWAISNPIWAVLALVLTALVVAIALVPAMHEVAKHGHPRC